MKKRILGVALIAAMAASLAACGSESSGTEDTSASGTESTESTESTDAASGELTEVTIGFSSWPTNMFYYLAEEEGIFEENGLDVTLQEFSSTTESINAFVGGQIDFVTSPSSETISPYVQSGAFSVVLMTDKSNGCEGLISTSDIETVADLEGKTIATQLYSVDHMFLLTLLEENGMTADDVNIVDMTIQEAGTAFIAGQCDAACIWDPYFTQAVESGGNVLFSSADEPDLITDALLASQDLCDNDPDTVTAMVKSFFDAVDYWEENPDEASEIMGEKLGGTAEDFNDQMAGLMIPTEEEVLEAFTEADDYTYWGYTQNTIRDFLYELEILETNEIDCGDMIDASFVESLIE